jgi:hypothetical protein
MWADTHKPQESYKFSKVFHGLSCLVSSKLSQLTCVPEAPYNFKFNGAMDKDREGASLRVLCQREAGDESLP